MDGIVLRGWMEKYLEEKYSIVEQMWAKQKGEESKPIETQDGRDWLKVWQDEIDKLPNKHVPELTNDQVQREGQARPVTIEYNPSAVEQTESLNRHKAKVREARRKYFLSAYPDADELEIEAYLNKFPEL